MAPKSGTIETSPRLQTVDRYGSVEIPHPSADARGKRPLEPFKVTVWRLSTQGDGSTPPRRPHVS